MSTNFKALGSLKKSGTCLKGISTLITENTALSNWIIYRMMGMTMDPELDIRRIQNHRRQV
jgi:hypothetical protein